MSESGHQCSLTHGWNGAGLSCFGPKHEHLDNKYIRKCGTHFFSRFSRLIEPYSTFFSINLSLYNVGPEPSILSGPNGGEPSKIR